MEKESPVYEVVDGVSEMIDKLVALNEEKFKHIDSSMVRLAMISNKEPPCRPPYFKIIKISNPVAILCPFRYVIVTWRAVWDQLGITQKSMLLLGALNHLDPDEDEPKLIPPDANERGQMQRR